MSNELRTFTHIEPLYKALAVLEHGDIVATEKLHGTNQRLILVRDLATGKYRLEAGSRSTTITNCEHPDKDFYGFVGFLQKHSYSERMAKLLDILEEAAFTPLDEIILHGEFVGKGIQKGVDYVGDTRHFYVFALELGDHHTEEKPRYYFVPPLVALQLAEEAGFSTVPVLYQGPPDLQLLTKLVEDATSEVAAQNGRASVMEGIVIAPLTPRLDAHGNPLFAKLKSEKFAEVAHQPKPVFTSDDEMNARAAAATFAMTFITAERVRHALDRAREQGEDVKEDMQDMKFLPRYVLADVRREAADEYSDALAICNKARPEKQEYGERLLNSAITKHVSTALKEALIANAVLV